jgi:hypothetical protein
MARMSGLKKATAGPSTPCGAKNASHSAQDDSLVLPQNPAFAQDDNVVFEHKVMVRN